jgi:hypothetical protein
VVILQLILGGQFLMFDDSNLYKWVVMNELMVHDGLIDMELDHNGPQIVLRRILNMRVQHRENDGLKENGENMSIMKIIHRMCINLFLIWIISNWIDLLLMVGHHLLIP